MTSTISPPARKRAPAPKRTDGTRCIWPKGVEHRYGISDTTRWRWEREHRLPPRDVYVDGKPVGWRPETLDAADCGETAA